MSKRQTEKKLNDLLVKEKRAGDCKVPVRERHTMLLAASPLSETLVYIAVTVDAISRSVDVMFIHSHFCCFCVLPYRRAGI